MWPDRSGCGREPASVGKAFALGSRVTIAPAEVAAPCVRQSQINADTLKNFRRELLTLVSPDANTFFVILNGEIVGYTSQPAALVSTVRRMHFAGSEPYDRDAFFCFTKKPPHSPFRCTSPLAKATSTFTRMMATQRVALPTAP